MKAYKVISLSAVVRKLSDYLLHSQHYWHYIICDKLQEASDRTYSSDDAKANALKAIQVSN